MPAPYKRSNAPIHNSKSGLTGFLINTGTSTPFNASAISWTANGFTVVRAPIQRISIPAFNASNTWSLVATSVDTSMPVSFFTFFNQANPSAPMPSNPPGFVRGFQIPARNILTPLEANPWAVSNTCSSVSALQGPAITIGRCVSTPGNANGSIFISIFVIYILIFNYQL